MPSDERDLLCGFLDWNRAVVPQKAEGLDREQATRVATPTGLTVLGLVTHLTVVEARWFRHHLLGEPDDDWVLASSFDVSDDLTVEAAVAAYRAACDRSRQATADLPLDTVSVVPHGIFGPVTLRWIIVHMIDETARHLGHLDVLRELTDGQVGDG